MSEELKHFYEFGPFRLDADGQLLLREGEPVPLTPKALGTLLALVESSGSVISREALIEIVWSDTYVEENNLSVNISMLRKILGQTEDGRSYIETLPRRGYRFGAEVRRVETNARRLVVERRAREQLIVIEEEHPNETTSLALPGLEARGSKNDRNWGHIILIVGVLLCAALGVLFYVRRSDDKDVRAQTIKTLAVLPLKPLGPEAEVENYLGAGIADALITNLGDFGDVSVRPTSAVLQFDDPKQNSLTSARALGVDAVLEGTYQRAAERIRVTVQLVSARDGTQLWSSTFEDQFTNIFAVQDSISWQVTKALVSNLDEARQRSLARRPTENVEAYQLYLKGRYLWGKKVNLPSALKYFERAVQIDPQYARAYAGLADCYLALSEHNLLPWKEGYAKAVATAQKAISLDATQPEAHTTLGFIYLSRDWDYPSAEREFKRALDLDPNYATAHQFHGVYLMAVGQKELAIAETRRALELDPLSILNNTQLARALYLAGRFDEAIEQSLITLELDSDSASARLYLGQAYAHKGMLVEARGELQKAAELAEGRAEMEAALAYAYALSSQNREAQKILGELSQVKTEFSYVAYHIATVYAGLQDRERAFNWLEKAYREHDIFIGVRLKTDPKLNQLRSDPRYLELVRKIGLPT